MFAPEHQKTAYDYVKYFWSVIIMLISGFDIPESVHFHIVSRIISILMLIMNLTVVALFTGQIISMFNHVLKRSDYLPQKPLNFKFKSPIIICGINNKLKDIIRELRKDKSTKEREIVVVDEVADEVLKFEEKENIEDVWYVKGNPMDRDILNKVIGHEDNRVIILSEKNALGKLMDTNAINTAIAVEAYYDKDQEQDIHTVLEITNNKNKYHFSRTEINEWICIKDYAMKLLSQAARQPGIVNVYMDLMGGCDSAVHENKIIFSSEFITPSLAETYFILKKRLHKKLRSMNILIIGFAKYIDQKQKEKLNISLRNSNYFIQVNPTMKPERNNMFLYEEINENNNLMKYLITEECKDDEGKLHYNYYKVADDYDYYMIGDELINSSDDSKKIYYWVFSRDTILTEKDKLICIKKNNSSLNYIDRKSRKEKKKEFKMYDKNKHQQIIKSLQKEIQNLKEMHDRQIEEIKKEPLKGHVIICNWNKKAEVIIEELHDESIVEEERSPIVIVTKSTQKIQEMEAKIFQDVFAIQGDPASKEILERANIKSAKTVIVLADDTDIETADSKSILIALAVDNINPDAHLIVELVYSRNEKYFKYTHVDEVVCLEMLSEKLLAQSALTPGLSRVYMDLLTQSKDTNEIYIDDVPQVFIKNKYTYSQVEEKIMDLGEDIILIGLSIEVLKFHSDKEGGTYKNGHGKVIHGRKIVINPSVIHNNNSENKKYDIDFSTDHIFKKTDKLIMIAFEKPDLTKLLKES